MENLVGQKFNRLTIIEVLEKLIPNTSRRCIAQCECGKVKNFILKHVRYGRTVSCGCAYGESRITHGMSGTKLAKVFKNMHNRCYNEKCEEYHNYGMRGIIICDEWMNDRGTFFKWAIENGYQDGLQIDRIDVNGIYEPNNCRFVTAFVNANNKRNNLCITIGSQTKSVGMWSVESGLSYRLIYERIKKGWPPEKAISIPVIREHYHVKNRFQ